MKFKILLSLLLCSFLLNCSSDSSTSDTNTKQPTNPDNDVMQEEMTDNDVTEEENTKPIAEDQSFVLQNKTIGTIVGTISASDKENDKLSYSIQQADSPFSINAQTGVITISEELGSITSFNITVIISDGNLTSSITVTITTNESNTATDLTKEQQSLIDTFSFLFSIKSQIHPKQNFKNGIVKLKFLFQGILQMMMKLPFPTSLFD